MDKSKYLNSVLTVIAFCLVIITLAITGLIPTAGAKAPVTKAPSLPLNSDGSVAVKFAPDQAMDINIDKIGGNSISYSPLPVKIEK